MESESKDPYSRMLVSGTILLLRANQSSDIEFAV